MTVTTSRVLMQSCDRSPTGRGGDCDCVSRHLHFHLKLTQTELDMMYNDPKPSVIVFCDAFLAGSLCHKAKLQLTGYAAEVCKTQRCSCKGVL